MKISVLISTYYGEHPDDVDAALKTTYNQTVTPDEVVIVEDGPLPSDLEAVIDKWAEKHPQTTEVIEFEENRGTGAALAVGLEACSHELIAKVDSDDTSSKQRFEKQLSYLKTHPEVDVVGGYMREIYPSGDENVREVPKTPSEVQSYARHRSPVNHPTAMYRRSAVEAVGGYREISSMQDYDLWVRLLVNGHTIGNIPEVLVETELDEDWYERRGGIDYLLLECWLFREFLNWGFIGWIDFVSNLGVRIPLRLAPSSVRKAVYSAALRD